ESNHTAHAKRDAFLENCIYELPVRSGHHPFTKPCPLYPQKRTNSRRLGTSALCQKRTSALQQSCLFDVFKSGEYRRLKRTIEIARVDFAGRDANLADCVAKCFGQILALLVEVSLLGDVIEIEGVGIGLIREGRAMPDNNHISAGTQRLD